MVKFPVNITLEWERKGNSFNYTKLCKPKLLGFGVRSQLASDFATYFLAFRLEVNHLTSKHHVLNG